MKRTVYIGQSRIALDTDGFDRLAQIIRELPSKRVRLGLLGNKAARTEPGPNNPEIGLVHEFGSKTKGIPERSFIRFPLMTHLPEEMRKVGPRRWVNSFLKAGVQATLTKLGIVCEAIVQKGFETHGYGTWAPNSPRTIARKGSAAPLIDTGEMRRAVTHDIVANKP